jgi:NADH-quinone oxidoreductase subunit I
MFGIGLLKGLRVTLRRCFSKPNTVEYPEQRLPVGPMFRGGCIDLNLEKCIACGLCAMSCPNSAIDLTTEKSESGKKVMVRYFHQLPVCLYCNYCIEVCPTQAITWTQNYEMSSLRHEDLIIDCMAGKGGSH